MIGYPECPERGVIPPLTGLKIQDVHRSLLATLGLYPDFMAPSTVWHLPAPASHAPVTLRYPAEEIRHAVEGFRR